MNPVNSFTPPSIQGNRAAAPPRHLQVFLALPPAEQERYRKAIHNAQPPRLFDNPRDQTLFEQAFQAGKSDPRTVDLIAGRAYEGRSSSPAQEMGGRLRQPAQDPANSDYNLSSLALEKLGFRLSGQHASAPTAKDPMAGQISPQVLDLANSRLNQIEAIRPGVEFLSSSQSPPMYAYQPTAQASPSLSGR